MDSFNFYKSLYERELKRRHDLEGSISPILTMLSAIVAILYFFNKDNIFSFCQVKHALPSCFFLFAVYFFLDCLYNLCKAYNNLFDGFDYKNLALPSEIRKMEILCEQDEIDYPNLNKDIALITKRRNFENGLLDQLLVVTDTNKLINDKRGFFFHKTKTKLIITFIFTIFQILILIIIKNYDKLH